MTYFAFPKSELESQVASRTMFRVFLLVLCVVVTTGSPVVTLESIEDELSCKLCLTFVQDLHKSLLNQNKQIKITHHLLSMCNELPQNEKSQCQDIVQGASPETMDIMAAQMKPEELCGHLGVCSAKEELKESPKFVEPVELKQPEVGGACELCEFVVQAVDQYIEQNKSEAAINATLYKICNKLPDVIKSTCLGFIPDLVQVLAQGLDPKESCTKIHLCTGDVNVQSKNTRKEIPSKATAGGACELCEFVVQAVDQYIEQNKSEAAINATLYKICNKLPDVIKSTCLGFIPDLVQVLAQGLDPKESCTKIHLCTGDVNVQSKNTRKEIPSKATAGGACELCEFVVQAVDQYIEQNKSEAAINATLYKICNKLPDVIKSTCLGFIPDLVQVLAQGLDPKESCTKIHLCTGDVNVQSKNTRKEIPSKATAGGACELCEFVVQAVDQYIEQNKSEAAINATLYKICNKLPDVIKSTCLSFIPDLVQVLAQGLDPKEACTKIHLCTGDFDVEIKKKIVEIPPKATAGGACELCEFVVQIVDQYVEQNKSEAAINATLYKICNNLPDVFQSTCIDFIPDLVQVLAQGLDPKEACTKIHLCTGHFDVETKNSIEEISPKATAGGACELCEFVVQIVDQYIEQNKSEAAINATLYKICNKLPDIIKSSCLSFIPDLVQVLAQGLDPKEACTKIHLCSGDFNVQTKTSIEEIPPKATAGGACELCEFIVQAVDQYIEQNKSEAAINATLYKICNKLPDVIKSTCLSFIPDLVQVLAQGLDPKEACTKIHLCTGSINVEKKIKNVIENIDLTANPECNICKFVVEILDSVIGENKTEKTVNSTLFKICNSLPDDFKKTCYSFAPNLAKVLTEEFDPTRACVEIKLCQEQIKPNVEARSLPRPKITDVKSYQAGGACELCEFVVQIVDQYIEQNKSEAAINATLYKICNKLPDIIKSSCLSFIPDLVQVLAQGLDPKEACTKIHLCTGNLNHHHHHMKDSLKTVVAVKSGGCDLCQFVVQTIDQFVKENKSEAAINSTLYKICNKLPDPLKTTCLTFAPNLVKVIAEGLDPKSACTKIHLCDGEIKHHEKPRENLQEKFGQVSCDFCKLIVEQVDNFLQDNTSSAAINATLDKICNSLPASFKALCKSYEPELIKALESGLDPVKACSDIHVCAVGTYENEKKRYASCDICKTEMKIIFPEDYKKWCSPECEEKSSENVQPLVSKKGFTLTEEPKEKENGAGCELCKLIVQEVDTYVKDNKSEAAINATLYKVCDSLPASFKILCLTYVPELEKALKNGLDPEKACEEIHVCKNNTMIRIVKRSVSLSFREVKCDLCKDIISSIDTDVYKDEDVVKKAIDDICDRFPEPVKDKCRQSVDPNWKNLWNDVFKNIATPEKLCDLLTLCKKTK